MPNVFQQINKMASGIANVHIYGETGTGKKVAAAMLHELSDRNIYPLITVDCAVFQKKSRRSGRFEVGKSLDTKAEKLIRGFLRQVGAGTLILNDINQMELDLQEKFLRIIKHTTHNAAKGGPAGTFIPRIITISRCPAQTLLRIGTLIPALFEHLGPTLINLKPLRHCKEILPDLANYYFSRLSNKSQIERLPESIIRRLLDYDWPGNLCELQNTIQRYLAYDEIIFLPARIGSDGSRS